MYKVFDHFDFESDDSQYLKDFIKNNQAYEPIKCIAYQDQKFRSENEKIVLQAEF